MFAHEEPGITSIIDLGNQHSGKQSYAQHGTEGYLQNLLVRYRARYTGHAFNVTGYNINGNVGYYYNLAAYFVGIGHKIVGGGNIAHTLIPHGMLSLWIVSTRSHIARN